MTLIEQNQQLEALKYGIANLRRELAKGNLPEVRYYADCIKEAIERLSQDIQQKLREELEEGMTK